jgi:hypothetical protein
MQTSLTTQEGCLILEVTYDPLKLDWAEAIGAGLSAYNISRHQAVTVIARPERVATDQSEAA